MTADDGADGFEDEEQQLLQQALAMSMQDAPEPTAMEAEPAPAPAAAAPEPTAMETEPVIEASGEPF